MAFIKTHLISLLSGVAALAFITVALLGMMSDSVVKNMKARSSIGRDLRSLKATAKNQACIDAEKSRGQRFEQEFNDTQAVTQRINERQPLLEGVFPTIEREKAAYDFRDKYRQAVRQLPRGALVGGDLPTAFEIQEAANDIAELLEQEAQKRLEGGAAAPTVATLLPKGDREPTGRSGQREAPTGSSVTSAALSGSKNVDPKYDANLRARVTKARSIRCYCSSEESDSPTFHISPIWNPELKPTAEEMWYAQVGLWIQQDVVAAVAELNEEASRRLRPEQAYVENMPVKRIKNIRVLGYFTEDGPILFGSVGRSTGPGEISLIKDTFTGRKSDHQFDVIRFTVTAVVDQRELLKLVDQVTKKNFYQLIGLKFSTITPEDKDYQDGYLYGAAPVVQATMDFEGYMARNVFEKLFPTEVRQSLGIADNNKREEP